MNDVIFLRRLILVCGLIPLLILGWDVWRDQLGPNAVNQSLHITGIVALVLLFLTLMVTPLKNLTGWNTIVAYRRRLGLLGFFYACVHLVIYVVYDRALVMSSVIEEVLTRRYLQIGALAVLLMVPLAVTSTNAMIARMGTKRWKLLHRLTYVAVALGVLHYFLLVKSDTRQPIAFAAVLTPVLGYRAYRRYGELRNAERKLKETPTQPSAVKSMTGKAGTDRFRGTLRVARVFQETDNVKTFRFMSPDGGALPFEYRAGQYLNLALDTKQGRIRRSYTLSSSPTRQGYVEISVKRDPRGVGSQHLHDHVHEGDLIELVAPLGNFTFDPSSAEAVILISGGVGITPVMSILRHLTDLCWEHPIYFINSVRTKADIVFKVELEQLAQRFPNLHLTTVVSDGAPDDVSYFKGRISADMLTKVVPDITKFPVFLCGPGPMMDGTQQLLIGLGVPAEQIHTEAFLSTGPAAEPPPAETGAATIHFTRSMKQLHLKPGQTILDLAEDSGIDLAWECRAGVCGQCRVRCQSGEVHMASREALTSQEIAGGWILACQSRPKTAEVSIEA